jgi:formyl-CoA transferase
MFLFEGLKVLDVGTWIAGPVSTTILADFGADVIKVEMPGTGDPYRNLPFLPGTPDAEVNYTWILDGRNKRSITLNLKSAEGQQALRALISECDVYVTNQPLAVRRAMGLTYEGIRQLNERMIYASLTAYGETGAEADKTGFDGVAYWARSGLADMVRAPGAPPAASIPGMGDHPSAMSMFACIMMGLYRRQMTGLGGMVSTSLLANGFWSASCLGQAALAGADFSEQREAAGVQQSWLRHYYPTADNRLLVFNMIRTPSAQEDLLKAVGLGELLEQDRFGDREARMQHSDELHDLMAPRLATEDSGHWLRLFSQCDLNVSRLAHLEDMLTDEQAIATGVLTPPVDDVGVPYVINPPLFVDGAEQVGPRRPPEVGEHTDEVLASLGYDAETIAAWRDSGKI